MTSAPEILDSIYKQVRSHQLRLYRPTLRIWINPHDLFTLILETNLLPTDAVARDGAKTVLFGEETVCSYDVDECKPTVEVVQS